MRESVKRSSASLRIFSQSIARAEIIERLQMQPTKSHEIGDPVSIRNPNSPHHRQALWLLQSDLEASESLDAHITQIVTIIEENMEAIESLRSCCEIDIMCFFSSTSGQGGFTLEPALLKRIALIGLYLTIDLYPPEL